MKNLSILLIAIASLFLFSCEKIEKPGNIPGMGNAPGELQAEKYEFHEDLTISSFKGVGEVVALKSAQEDDLTYNYDEVQHGSGDQVILEVTITNNSNDCRTAYFLAGTVFKVNKGGYQNGILLSPVVVCLDGNETKVVTLQLYCLNLGLEGSDESASYEFLGVSTSESIKNLLDRLRFKMLNYEHYLVTGELTLYHEIVKTLQDAVWEITNGGGNVDGYMEFINSIPRVPHGYYPDGIYNENPDLPVCWCAPCGQETAFGGNAGYNIGAKKPWWYSFDVDVNSTSPQTQKIYAGQYIEVGTVTYNPIDGTITIELSSIAKLKPGESESVKIQGYDELPDKRPAGGHFDNKGTSLTVNVAAKPYYVIHLDVVVCDED